MSYPTTFSLILLSSTAFLGCDAEHIPQETDTAAPPTPTTQSWRFSERDLDSLFIDVDYIREHFKQTDSLELDRVFHTTANTEIPKKDMIKTFYGLPFKWYEFDGFDWVDTLREEDEQGFIGYNGGAEPTFGHCQENEAMLFITLQMRRAVEEFPHLTYLLVVEKDSGKYVAGWAYIPRQDHGEYELRIDSTAFSVYDSYVHEEETTGKGWCYKDTMHTRYQLEDGELVMEVLKKSSVGTKGSCE